MSARTARPRRARGAQESLAQVVLAFESIIVFLAGLAVFGLRALPDGIEPWWAIVAGAVFAVVMMAASGVVRWRWGIVLGWVLQVLLALSAFLVPSILIAALIFGGMWAYATIKGASLDRRNARLAAASPPANGV
ncbi:DUF4233 domain-containing protein [Microbacterium sp. NPDC089189]|uniref:DUF4233 domain-containing protein n=1 Tax=Microbacterium sp. NPDC089189 TaxID=3154972 RepID=UPI0034149073